MFYLRERIRGPLLYTFWDPAGLSSNGLWERDEEPDDVLSSGLLPSVSLLTVCKKRNGQTAYFIKGLEKESVAFTMQ